MRVSAGILIKRVSHTKVVNEEVEEKRKRKVVHKVRSL